MNPAPEKMGLGLELNDWTEIQGKLLSGKMSRIQMLDLLKSCADVDNAQTKYIRIWRNFAVEPMEIAFRVLGLYWGISYDLMFMGYDDSLSFAEITTAGISDAIEIIMVDKSHYQLSDEDFDAWLRHREEHLTEISMNKVVTVVVDEEITIRVLGNEVSRILPDLNVNSHFDSRYERTTGSRLTPRTHFLIARELSTAWVPSFFFPPRKLIAVDLDHTLHEGVLGELLNEVVVNDDFYLLQQELGVAKSRGFMLAIISKNNRGDVLGLLNSHPRYRLRESDFVAIEASWDSKQNAMTRILDKTRINAEAVLFIDDNPIELLQMKATYPQMGVVSAIDGPVVACQSLSSVPGYRRQSGDTLGETRIQDIQSNEQRAALIENGLMSYYQTAKPVFGVSVGNSEELDRLVDLGKRSNQFNLTLSRLDEASYKSNESIWVSLSLKDQFSDSGTIGGLVIEKSGIDDCTIRELFLSCRVLGRGLETSLICQAILQGMNAFNVGSVAISWVIGPRNEPAISWLTSTFLNEAPVSPGSVTMLESQIRQLSEPPQGVKVEITRRD